MSRTAMGDHTPAARGHSKPNRARSTAVALAIVALTGSAVWLAMSSGTGGDQTGTAVEELSHVHGLQIPAWADGDVFVATHQGAFRVRGDDWTWVSEQPHDFMGFAAHPNDEGALYSSGHPAPGSRLANPIGFMASTDAGITWEPRSLQGEVDFHAMAVHPAEGDTIHGYDGRRGLLRTADGGQTWETLPAPALEDAGVMSLAVGAGDDEVYAGTEAGLLHSTDAGGSWETLITAPVTAVHVDVSDPRRLLAYVAADGQGLLVRDDEGESWQPLGLTLDDDAAGHVAVDPSDADTIWAATFGGSLWRTTDGGQRWELLVEEGARTAR